MAVIVPSAVEIVRNESKIVRNESVIVPNAVNARIAHRVRRAQIVENAGSVTPMASADAVVATAQTRRSRPKPAPRAYRRRQATSRRAGIAPNAAGLAAATVRHA